MMFTEINRSGDEGELTIRIFAGDISAAADHKEVKFLISVAGAKSTRGEKYPWQRF